MGQQSQWVKGWAAALILLLIIFGCAAPSQRGPGSSAHQISGVPFVAGEPGACGPAALSSLLAFWGDPVSADDIGRALAPPSHSWSGILPMDLARFAASRGSALQARTLIGSLDVLREHVRRDQPLIAFLDLGVGPWRQGHFVVVIGYRDTPGEVLVYSGREPDTTMSYDRFARAWKRGGSWALTLHPSMPGEPGA